MLLSGPPLPASLLCLHLFLSLPRVLQPTFKSELQNQASFASVEDFNAAAPAVAAAPIVEEMKMYDTAEGSGSDGKPVGAFVAV